MLINVVIFYIHFGFVIASFQVTSHPIRIKLIQPPPSKKENCARTPIVLLHGRLILYELQVFPIQVFVFYKLFLFFSIPAYTGTVWLRKHNA